MWCICTIWPNAPESQSVTMPYSHQNYWMHVFFFLGWGGEHFGLWNVKIVVSAAESNFLRGLSETLNANLARIKDFSHFSLSLCQTFHHYFCILLWINAWKRSNSSSLNTVTLKLFFFLSFYFLFSALRKMCVGFVALWKTQDVAQLYFLFLFQKEI